MNKILKITLIFLLIIIFIEIGYYIYLKTNSNISTSKPKNPYEGFVSDKDLPNNFELNPQVVSTSSAMRLLRRIGRMDNQKLYLFLEIEGFVRLDENPTDKSLNLTILDKNNQKIVSIGSGEWNLFKESKGIKTSIKPTELKNGQRILNRRYSDLIKPDRGVMENIIYDQ